MKMNRIVMFVVALLLLLSFGGCRLYTVVPMVERRVGGLVESQTDQDFDAVAYVEENWVNIEGHSVSNAHNIEEVVSLFNTNKAECFEKYAARQVDDANLVTIIVSGEVKIVEINRDSKVGLMGVDIVPYDGIVDAYVQVGPVYRRNLVRDAMPFIRFEDVKNQVTFGVLGSEINNYINTNVVLPANVEDRIGQLLNIVGVFTQDDEIILTPVVMTPVE